MNHLSAPHGPVRGPLSTDPLINDTVFGCCYVVPDYDPAWEWLFSESNLHDPVAYRVAWTPSPAEPPLPLMLRYSDETGHQLNLALNERLAERAIDRIALVLGVVGVTAVVAHYATRRA